MTENRRIVLNIVATYGRSLFALACGVFGGRWALMSLGEVNYGLHGLVAGLTVFISFFNDVLGASLGRFYALAVGRARVMGDDGVEECRRWFSLAVLIHAILPVCLFVVGWPVGEWAIRHYLTIPPDRVAACGAKQYIAELTVYGFICTSLNIIMLGYMVSHPGDWLVKYAFWLTLLGIVPTIIIAFRSVKLFPECRFRLAYCMDGRKFRQLLAFSFWQGFGAFTTMLRTNGIAVIINRNFGPAVNASLAVARNLGGKADELASAMLGAFTPAVTSAYGAGDLPRAFMLADRMCKFGVLASLVFMVPVAVELPYLMRLWLVNPPEHATTFCLMVMLQRVINKLTKGHALLIQATGRIGLYEFVVALLGMLMLGATIVLIASGVGPFSICYSLVAFAILYAGIRPFFVRRFLEWPICPWIKGTLFPQVGSTALAVIAGICTHRVMSEGFPRLMVSAVVCESVLCLFSWFWVLGAEERMIVKEKARRALSSLRLLKGKK